MDYSYKTGSLMGNCYLADHIVKHQFGKELFIRFTCVVLERLSNCLYATFPFGFEGEMWE